MFIEVYTVTVANTFRKPRIVRQNPSVRFVSYKLDDCMVSSVAAAAARVSTSYYSFLFPKLLFN